jgi:hypothetical protein
VHLGELPYVLERLVGELGPVGCPCDCLEHDVPPFLTSRSWAELSFLASERAADPPP